MMNRILLAALLGATTSHGNFDLQKAIDDARSGTEILVPAGTYTQPITIKKGITLKGETGAMLKVESNEPAILIDAYKDVILQDLTIQSKMAGNPRQTDSPFAVLIRAGNVTLHNCTIKALGSGEECPGAVSAQDRSDVTIRHCRLDGFEFSIQFWNGAAGRVEDCLVMNPGHCGVTIGSGANVVIERNIVSGSGYHGIRCTGGQIAAKFNLVVRNRNRGFYLGNKSAIGEISNNLIVDNATGIDVFANSRLEIAHNVIVRSSYAGLSIIDTAKLKIENNIVADNEKGFVGFAQNQNDAVSVSVDGRNLVHGNKTAAERVDLPSKTVTDNPAFTDPDSGLFQSRVKAMGLEEPAAMQELWTKWQAALNAR